MTPIVLWSLALRGTIDILIASLAVFALSRSSAARRHVAWLAGTIGLILLPITFLGLPQLPVKTEPSSVVAQVVRPLVVAAHSIPPITLGPAQSAGHPVTPVIHNSFDWLYILPTLWWVGFTICLLYLMLGLGRAALIATRAKTFRVENVAGKGENVAGKGEIEVRASNEIEVPSVIGWLRPVILIPSHACAWSSEKLRIAIAHEVGHVKRNDWLWQQVAALGCAIHFFNPLAWWAAKRLREESEYACDDTVIAIGIAPVEYAQELIDIAKLATRRRTAFTGMASSPDVTKRLTSILDLHRSRAALSRTVATVLLLLVVALLLPFGMLAIASPKPRYSNQRKYWSKLPQIPTVASDQVGDNVYLAKNGIASLPGGVNVRLVGLSLTSNDDFWDQAKKTIPDTEMWRQGGVYWQGPTFHTWSHGSPPGVPLRRTFLVEVESQDGGEYATSDEIIDPAPSTNWQKLNPEMAGKDDMISVLSLAPKTPTGGWIELGVAKAQKEATYRFGIAGPDWQTISKTSNPIYGALGQDATSGHGGPFYGFKLGEHPVMFYQDSDGAPQSVNLKDDRPAGTALRLILLDKFGKQIENARDPGWDTQGEEMFDFDRETFGKIATIELQASPYRYAEFRNVPLRPNFEAEEAARLTSKVVGTATGIAPGFTKPLNHGGSVSLAAVSKPIRDGINWRFLGQPVWRADGEVLANPPKEADWDMPVKTWGENQLVRYQIQLNGLKDASTTLVPRGDLDPTYWLRDQQRFEWVADLSQITEYLPDAKFGDLRVGVASTDWKTVYEYPVRIKELSAIAKQDRPDSGIKNTGLEVLMQSKPELTDYSSGKTVHMVDQPMDGSAMRLVAVLKNGSVKILNYCSSGRSFNVYDIPARHGEFSEMYNQILTSDVSAIQLQARPYEWVDFDHIPLNHN